jgi:hypothetical protein
MRHLRAALVTASALTATLAACDDATLTVGDFVTESATRTCGQVFACITGNPSAGPLSRYGATEAECRVKLGTLAPGTLDLLQASIDAGRITYRPADAQACLDALDTRTCAQLLGTDYFPWPAPCESMIEGTVPGGGACTLDEDCTGGATCTSARVCAS